MKTKLQKRKLRNKVVAFLFAFIFGYILLINNSLDFLIKFGYETTKTTNTTIAFIGFFLTMAWVVWKKQLGEL